MLGAWRIGLDAAATLDSALVPNYLGPDHDDPNRRDALAWDDWSGLAPKGSTVFVNPPYTPTGVLSAFLSKAVATADAGRPVVSLLPASTGAAWWWKHVADAGASVEFLRGRLAFGGPHAGQGRGSVAPWASALVEWLPPRSRSHP